MADPVVVLDTRCVSARPTGVGRWTANLILGLDGLPAAQRVRWCAITQPDAAWPPAITQALAGMDGQIIEVDRSMHNPRGWRSVVRAVESVGADWLVTPDAFAPLWGDFRRATVIHDAIPITQGRCLRRSVKSRVPGLWRAWLFAQSRRSDVVLTVSRCAARQLAGLLGLPASKLAVVGNAVAPPERAVDRKASEGPPWLLYVGRRDPYKNVPMLVRLTARLREQGISCRLAIVGPADHRYPEAEREAERLGLGPDAVRFVGPVDEAELDRWYARAAVVTLPSLEEGFGLPALEAMAHDVPVACSNRSGLAEAVGRAAVSLDPRSDEIWAQGVGSLLQDPERRNALVQAGRVRAERYTPRRQARRVLRALGLA
ncbi:MAG: glycosyltransferase family 1 protein [Planctomycetota bacterium]